MVSGRRMRSSAPRTFPSRISHASLCGTCTSPTSYVSSLVRGQLTMMLSPQTTMCDSLVSLRATGFLSSLPNDSTVPNNTPLVLERRPTRTSCCGGNLAARPAAHRGAAEGHVHQRAYLCLWAKNRSSALLNVQQDAHTHTLGTREIDRRRTALA